MYVIISEENTAFIFRAEVNWMLCIGLGEVSGPGDWLVRSVG
jgi:hypothetical protein